ncbi:hypothetical protein C8F04DRAFT_1393929 [Mycena alexandri]|uniref:Uncharacterized protein n=1 Tax=Mycena alexandri TaxID=1745969 RepID=A0AAD6SZJ7_9AGAR|nr:hypothetical protein C8F04DRAFT_1393929 [Mycena alexandri]
MGHRRPSPRPQAYKPSEGGAGRWLGAPEPPRLPSSPTAVAAGSSTTLGGSIRGSGPTWALAAGANTRVSTQPTSSSPARAHDPHPQLRVGSGSCLVPLEAQIGQYETGSRGEVEVSPSIDTQDGEGAGKDGEGCQGAAGTPAPAVTLEDRKQYSRRRMTCRAVMALLQKSTPRSVAARPTRPLTARGMVKVSPSIDTQDGEGAGKDGEGCQGAAGTPAPAVTLEDRKQYSRRRMTCRAVMALLQESTPRPVATRPTHPPSARTRPPSPGSSKTAPFSSTRPRPQRTPESVQRADVDPALRRSAAHTSLPSTRTSPCAPIVFDSDPASTRAHTGTGA